LQTSATSQSPFFARQTVPWGFAPLSTQAPLPLQVSLTRHATPWSPHGEPEGSWFARQLPAPSQRSGLVQASSSELPHAEAAARGPQVPLVDAPADALQAWQSEVLPLPQAVLQQTPSTQKPLVHSLACVQLAPLALLTTQDPPAQR